MPEKKQLLHVTSEGNVANIMDESISRISLADVLSGLANEYRFCGRIPWSVLQHSTVVGLSVQDLYPLNLPLIQKGFTHDFQEFATRDVPTPLKNLVGPAWWAVENDIQKRVLGRFGINADISDHDETLLLEIDRVAGYVEAVHFFGLNSDIVEEMSKSAGDYSPTVVITVTRRFYQILEHFNVFDEQGIISNEVMRMYKDVITVNNL